jgi:hypothetical protein
LLLQAVQVVPVQAAQLALQAEHTVLAMAVQDWDVYWPEPQVEQDEHTVLEVAVQAAEA